MQLQPFKPCSYSIQIDNDIIITEMDDAAHLNVSGVIIFEPPHESDRQEAMLQNLASIFGTKGAIQPS